MSITETTIKKWGNSLGIIIPKEEVRKLNLKKDETIVVEFTKKKRIDGFGLCKGSTSFVREPIEHEEFWE